jgi:hypothetical protein
VRIGIGMNMDRPVYRVAQISSEYHRNFAEISGIHEGNKKYKIGKKKTQKVAVLKHAGSSKYKIILNLITELSLWIWFLIKLFWR